jgi:hypothetical protein
MTSKPTEEQMNERDKTNTQHQVGAAAGYARSDNECDDTCKLSPDAQAMIGRKLKSVYYDLVAEPLPAKFTELLARLAASDDAPEDKS